MEVCRLYPYNEGQLNLIVKNIWRMGLVIGEELLKLDDNKEGLRIELNGRTFVTVSDASRSDDGISFAQLKAVVEALGGTLQYDSSEQIDASLDGKEAHRICADAIRPGEDVYALAANGQCVNATHLLADLGVRILLDGKTVKVTYPG